MPQSGHEWNYLKILHAPFTKPFVRIYFNRENYLIDIKCVNVRDILISHLYVNLYVEIFTITSLGRFISPNITCKVCSYQMFSPPYVLKSNAKTICCIQIGTLRIRRIVKSPWEKIRGSIWTRQIIFAYDFNRQVPVT